MEEQDISSALELRHRRSMAVVFSSVVLNVESNTVFYCAVC
jgi:hypothetical protein